MATRTDLKDWVVEALKKRKGTGWPREISKDIWENHKKELEASGDLLYTWQYDVRWAAQSLRNSGILEPVHGRRDLPWSLL